MMWFLFLQFKCCGIDNATDFEDAKKWPRGDANFSVPLICCKNVNDTSCAKYPTLANSYINQVRSFPHNVT